MEETLIKRVMPNSLEAEQSVIGSMIMDQDAIVTAMEILLQEDFYHKQYGILFDAMIELYSSGQPESNFFKNFSCALSLVSSRKVWIMASTLISLG